MEPRVWELPQREGELSLLYCFPITSISYVSRKTSCSLIELEASVQHRQQFQSTPNNVIAKISYSHSRHFPYFLLSLGKFDAVDRSGQCGYRPGKKIVGGTEATKGSWPWQAQLLTRSNSQYYLCGGTLVDNNWVVTAANCTENAEAIFIR